MWAATSSAPAARSRTSTPCARSCGPSSTRLTARSSCSRRGDARGGRARAGKRGAGAPLEKREPQAPLPATQAKKVLSDMLEHGGDPAAIASELGFEGMDQDALAAVVDELIAEHPEEFERLKGGDQKVIGFFVG